MGHVENPRNTTSKHQKKTCLSHPFIGSTQIQASKAFSTSFSTILGRPGDLKDTAHSDGRSPAESSSSSRLAMEGNDERFGLKMWHLHCVSRVSRVSSDWRLGQSFQEVTRCLAFPINGVNHGFCWADLIGCTTRVLKT